MRRLCALVHGLPADSATWRETAWSREVELAAGLIEVVDLWGRRYASMHGVKESDIPEPIRISRPGEEEPKLESNQAKIREFFAKHFV